MGGGGGLWKTAGSKSAAPGVQPILQRFTRPALGQRPPALPPILAVPMADRIPLSRIPGPAARGTLSAAPANHRG